MSTKTTTEYFCNVCNGIIGPGGSIGHGFKWKYEEMAGKKIKHWIAVPVHDAPYHICCDCLDCAKKFVA